LFVYDIIDAPRSVKRLHAAPKEARRASLSPALLPAADQSLTPALSVELRY
jgi:hypothetical protein